jgi:folate-binding protein YgfZ
MIAFPEPQVLEIAGADAIGFSHAQFSNDVRALSNGDWQWNAWLSPQGRIRAFFCLLRDSDQRLRLLLRGGSAEELRAALTPYVLRTKVTLHVIADLGVLGSYDKGDVGSDAIALPGVPSRWLILRDSPAASAADAELERWRLADIRAGLPEVAEALRDQLLPQWLGLDRLGAISVRKGCYPGQEVMSRLHFKGGNKRSLYRLTLSATTLPAAGTDICTGTETVGQIISAAHAGAGQVEALASLVDTAVSKSLQSRDFQAAQVVVAESFA